MPQFLDVGTGPEARRIAVRVRQGAGPRVVWLGGFRSDMRSTKAEALDAWAARIRGWSEHADVVVYFDNDAKGFAPHDAERLLARLG